MGDDEEARGDFGAAEVSQPVVGAPLVGPVRPWTPFLQRVWDEGCAYTDRWPEEASERDLLPTPPRGAPCRSPAV